jgi:hypothetical protein
MPNLRINKLAASDHAKRPLKRATTWYTKEKNKTGGLSSLQIEAKVKKEFDGVGPHAATIRRYVNTNIAGMSPLKIEDWGEVGCASVCVQVALHRVREFCLHPEDQLLPGRDYLQEEARGED